MDIVMPKMGESVSEGTIIKWHKKEGDQVKLDEIIFEISTDKVDTEIPSPASGVLKKINTPEGDTVEVGSVVAVIDATGESEKAAASEQKAESSGETKTESVSDDKSTTEKTNEKVEQKVEIKQETKVDPVETDEASVSVKGEELEIQMPKMGESVMEGTIIKWHKKVGEKVKKDETIFEISTDKVDTEVPSPADGVLSEVLVGEQETVEVGTIVAKLSSSNVPAKNKAGKEKTVPEPAAKDTKEEEKPMPSSMHENFYDVKSSSPEETAEDGKSESNKFLSPLVLNIARKENVSFDELDKIKGSGLDGRISKKDILSYIEKRKQAKPMSTQKHEEEFKHKQQKESAETSQPSFTSSNQMDPVYSSGDIEKIPMGNLREKIMQHMINSRDTSVHVAAMLEVDMTRIYNFIQKYRDEYQRKEGIKLTYMPFVANACVKGLKEYPLINSAIEGSTIIKKKFINLGIAVAIEPTGLIVPNIKGADQRNIIGLAKSISDLANRARTKKLTPDDISNGTFTITNYGVFGTIFGTPIINQPEVAILGVGTVIKKPVVVEVDGADTIAIKPVMALTLSHDHRLVDGMLGGRFLKFLKDTLEGFNEESI